MERLYSAFMMPFMQTMNAKIARIRLVRCNNLIDCAVFILLYIIKIIQNGKDSFTKTWKHAVLA